MLGAGVQGQNTVLSGCRGDRQTDGQVMPMWPVTCYDGGDSDQRKEDFKEWPTGTRTCVTQKVQVRLDPDSGPQPHTGLPFPTLASLSDFLLVEAK